MTVTAEQISSFIKTVNADEIIWALQNEQGEWVVCDSGEFEDADVIPVWTAEDAAQAFCVDEWAGYKPASIALEDFLEDWIEDLNDDGVLVGVDWKLDQETIEIDAIKLATFIVKV